MQHAVTNLVFVVVVTVIKPSWCPSMRLWRAWSGEEAGSEAPSRPEKQPKECGAEEGLLWCSVQETWEEGCGWNNHQGSLSREIAPVGDRARGDTLPISLCKQLWPCGLCIRDLVAVF